MARQIILFLVFALCVLGPSGVMAVAAFASINALGRNPSAAPKIFTAMTITLIFAEALAIIAMLIIFQLFQTK
jgi:F0F1-type ATP synthase membrane subunit c/vacuolar-type H+-ATPase subunit K